MRLESDRLYLGDCMDLMRGVGDGSVDMVLCDLPYGVLSRRSPSARWDTPLPLDELWGEYARVVKPSGAIVLFAQGMFTARLMVSGAGLWRYNLVWCKGDGVTGFLNANRMPMRNHEDICVFYRRSPKYHPQFEACARPHARGGAGNGAGMAANGCYGGFGRTPAALSSERYPRSVLFFDRPGRRLHPTEKPVELLSWLVRTYTDEGDVVLDNAMGSGSACVACVMEGRRYIGIEKDAVYYDIARRRVESAVAEKSSAMPHTVVDDDELNAGTV